MEGIYLVIVSLVISIGLFLIFRGIVLWYWRIDKMVGQNKQTNELLNNILTEIKKANQPQEEEVVSKAPPKSFFKGKTVVLTGSFRLEPQYRLKQRLIDLKANIEREVDEKTDILIKGYNPEFLQELKTFPQEIQQMTEFEAHELIKKEKGN